MVLVSLLADQLSSQFLIFFSPVHVVLVSLLVDQLSGLFLIFLVDQKKIVQSQGIFGQSLGIFGQSLGIFG